MKGVTGITRGNLRRTLREDNPLGRKTKRIYLPIRGKRKSPSRDTMGVPRDRSTGMPHEWGET
jgi:hypothetical protein